MGATLDNKIDSSPTEIAECHDCTSVVFLITMFDGRLNLSKQVLGEVKGYFGDKLFKTVIHRNVRLGEAPSFGKPALLYDANSVGAQDYMTLVEEIISNGC